MTINALLMKDIKSLKKETERFSLQVFPELHTVGLRRKAEEALRSVNDPLKAALVAFVPSLTLLICGLAQGPSILTCKIIAEETAKTIIDQRITNLATIFSITLVVIGWLITNMTSKERLSMVLMARKTYLYPIFYYILSLVGSLIILSFLREVDRLNFGNILIAASVLIIIALILISFLFVQLIRVVDNKFLVAALDTEVMNELYAKAKSEILVRKSKESVRDLCKLFGLQEGIRFGANLSNHTGIVLNYHDETPADKKSEVEVFFPDEKYRIADINLSKLYSAFGLIHLDDNSLFLPAALNQQISANYAPFYIHGSTSIPKKAYKRIKGAFKLRAIKSNQGIIFSTQYQEFLHERILKEIKDGKVENVKSTLSVYTNIFNFENKLVSHIYSGKNHVEIYGNGLRTVFMSFYSTIDNGDVEVFTALDNFIYHQLNTCYEANNAQLYELFARVYVRYYEHVLSRSNSTLKYRDIYELCADRAPRAIKSRLGWGFRSISFGDQISDEEQNKINNYSKILLNQFADLLYVCFQNKDLSNLKFLLNQLYQCSDSYNHRLSNQSIEINFLRSQKSNESSAKRLEELEERHQLEGFTLIRVRLIFKASLYWAIFLYQTNILSKDELNQIMKEYETYRGFLDTEFLQDLIMLRNFSNQRNFSWASWDHIKKRPEGITYSPPSVDQWAPFSAILYALNREKTLGQEKQHLTSEEIAQIENLTGLMLRHLEGVEKSGIEKWKELLKVSNEEEFFAKLQSFRVQLEGLHKTTISAKEEMIAKQEIDPEYVSNFKKILCDGWEKGNIINELFGHFGNNILTDAKDEELEVVGIRNHTFQGYKQCLIRSEDLHIPIFGTERLGQDLADIEEYKFFQNAVEGQKKTEQNLTLSEIDRVIDKLMQKEKQASIILLGYHAWDTLFGSTQPANYVYNYSNENEFGFSTYAGKYRGIPLARVRNVLMTNSIMVCDFKSAFELNRKSNESDFKNVLHVNVRAISEDEAKEIIAEDPAYQQSDLSHDDAVTSLMNDILIDFYLKENFKILDSDAYEVLLIEQ